MPTSPLSGRRAVVAVVTLFFVNGLTMGAYAGSLPLLRDRFGLTGFQLPAVLFCAGIFALAGMQVSGRLADRLGARTLGLAALVPMAIGVLVMGFSPAYAGALVGAAIMGFGNGGIDVAMNAYGVEVEKARPKPIMSFFHALWSFGNFAGAGLVLLTGRLVGDDPARSMAAILTTAAAVIAVTLAVLSRTAPPSPRAEHHEQGTKRGRIPAAAWALGLMAVAFGLGEGTAYDWSSIHVRDVTHVSTSTAALGLAVVSAFMVAIRLIGDSIVARFGRRAVVRFGGVCAAAGYFVVALATPLWLVLVGWALVGFGIGMVAPQVYAVAGHMGGGRVLAVVVTFGYATFLAGPAVTGALINWLGIRSAMFVPAVLCLGLLALAVVLPRDDRGETAH